MWSVKVYCSQRLCTKLNKSVTITIEGLLNPTIVRPKWSSDDNLDDNFE